MVISASRTKDIVRHSPDKLTSMLKGENDCRLSFAGKSFRLSLEDIHTLVLWTKSPRNILYNKSLNEILNDYVRNYNGLIYLQLTVTGFGGSFIEYDIPYYQEVFSIIKKILETNLIFPESVKLRYDPYLKIITPNGYEITNVKSELFEEIVSCFSSIGIKNYTTSEVDFVNYPQVKKRIEGLGLNIVKPSERESTDFIQKMEQICKKYDSFFSICCNPYISEFVSRQGCIDGKLFNEIKNRRFGNDTSFADVRLHNKVTGGQRPNCFCTYSYDIGYSRGFTTCYKNQSGCIYCYSQQNMNKKLKQKIIEKINLSKS